MQIGGKGTRSDFAMARPAFTMSLLRPLQRLADAHPKSYVFFVFLFLVVPSLACDVLLNGASQGITILILNSFMAAALFGFISSRFNSLDMMAVRHVVSSFRFAACIVLLAMWSLLSIRRAHQGVGHPAGSAALIVLTVVFMGQALLDCSPHLSPSVQIVVSVICSLDQIFSEHISPRLVGRMVVVVRLVGCWNSPTSAVWRFGLLL
jgi:hypothetical protein